MPMLMAPWLCMLIMVVAVMAADIPRGLSAPYLVLFCLVALWQVESVTTQRRAEAGKSTDPMVAWWRRVMGSEARP